MHKLALIFALLLVAGCGNGVGSGRITAKLHEPAVTWQEWDECDTSYNTTEVYIDYEGDAATRTVTKCVGGYDTKHDDEDWFVKLEQCVTDSESTSGQKCKTGGRYISPDAWYKLEVGQYYDGNANVNDWDSDQRGWGL